MSTTTTVKDKKTGELSLRVKYAPHELLEHAYQFADELTRAPANFTYDELVEDLRACVVENKKQGRVIVIMTDNSSVEFFRNSQNINAHPSSSLDVVLTTDSRVAHIHRGMA